MFNKDRIFERILHSNLNGSDKELEYLLIFLEINLSKLTESRESLNTIIDKPNQSTDMNNIRNEIVPSINKTYQTDIDLYLRKHCNTLSLSLVQLPDSLHSYYQSMICRQCSLCSKIKLSIMCLLCGDVICLRTCGSVEEFEKPDLSSFY